MKKISSKKLVILICFILFIQFTSGCISTEFLPNPPESTKHPDMPVIAIDSDDNSYIIWNTYEQGKYNIKFNKISNKEYTKIKKIIVSDIIYVPKILISSYDEALHYFYRNSYLKISLNGSVIIKKSYQDVSRYSDKFISSKDIDATIDNEGKWDAVLSVIRKRDKNGKFIKADPREYKPKGPYMKYLADKELLNTHIQDFMNRIGGKKMYNSDPTPLPEESYCDNWITHNGIEMLKEFPENKPWHLVVNFVCPHDPWDITVGMKENWNGIIFPKPFKGSVKSVNEELKVRQNYAAMLENIDRNVGIFIEEVKKRGEMDNTIIIYSSDHGEMLGDFRRYNKMVPERGATKIPLVISGPEM